MKKFLTFIVSSLVCFSLKAQILLSGQVKSNADGSAIPFALMQITNTADSSSEKLLTDEKGFFEITLNSGSYSLKISATGFMDTTLYLNLFENQSLPILLTPNTEQIDKITIIGKKNYNAFDKQIYTITEQMRKRSSTTEDLLNQITGITYDPYKDQLSVDGDYNIIILVNGLEKSIEYIKSLNPQRIAKVEIIRDPSGKYGIKGYSAVINIILKDNFQGYEFFVNVFDISNLLKKMHISTNLMTNFDFTKNKVNFYTNIFYSKGKFILPTSLKRLYSDSSILVKIPPSDYTQNLIADFQYLYTTLGLDYNINPLNVVSAEINFNNGFNLSNNYFDVKYYNNNTYNSYREKDVSNNLNQNFDINLFYKGHINKNIDIQSDLTFGRYKDESTSEIFINNEKIVTSAINYKTKNFETNTDLTFNFKKFFLNNGFGFVFKNNFTDLGNQYSENRIRAYMYFGWKPNEKISLKIGDGAEAVRYLDYKNNYIYKFIHQPFFNLLLNPLKFLQITFKFRTKNQYPSFYQLNPEPTYTDVNIIKIGNPYLKPTAIYKNSILLNILGGLLSIEPYYEFSNNYIASVGQPSDSIMIFKYENVGLYKSKGITLNFTIPFGKKIFLQNSLEFYDASIEYQNNLNKISDWTGSSQLIYYNPKIVSFGFMYQRMNGKNIKPQGYYYYNNDDFGFVLMKNDFKNFDFMLIYLLPVKGSDKFLRYWQIDYGKYPNYEETQTNDVRILKNLVIFRIAYRFSKGKVKKFEKQNKKEQKMQNKTSIF